MGMWRLEEPVLDANLQVAKGGMWPSQRKAYVSKAYIMAFLGGYGSGKSFLSAKFAIAMALHNAPSPFMAVSPSYKMAKRTIIPAIKTLLDGRKIQYKYNNTDHAFDIRHGGIIATIWVGSGQDADSLKGSNLCGFLMDEFAIQDEGVFTQLLARVRDPAARVRRVLLAGTPEGVIGWAYDMCHENGKNRKNYDVEVIEADTRENKALPADFIRVLENAYDEKMQEAYMRGKFVNLSRGRIYYNFDQDVHVKRVEVMEEEEVFLGLDFNVNPFTGVLFVKRNKKICYFKEVIMVGDADTPSIMDEAWEESNHMLTTIFPDPSGIQKRTSAIAGASDFTHIAEAGIRNRGEKFKILSRRRTPSLRDRWNATNAHLRAGLVEVDPSCTTLIRGLSYLTHENRGNSGEQFTHVTDAATYVIENLFSVSMRIQKKRRFYN